jgi:hypothetical protein
MRSCPQGAALRHNRAAAAQHLQHARTASISLLLARAGASQDTHSARVAQQTRPVVPDAPPAEGTREDLMDQSRSKPLHVHAATSSSNAFAQAGAPTAQQPRLVQQLQQQEPLAQRARSAAIIMKTWAIGAVDTMGNMAENLAARLGWDLTPHVPATPLAGKVAIVTGGNTGIGFATAEMLATRGAHVILACRSAERGEAAAAVLRTQRRLLPSCKPNQNASDAPCVEFMQVDLASLDRCVGVSACCLMQAAAVCLHMF